MYKLIAQCLILLYISFLIACKHDSLYGDVEEISPLIFDSNYVEVNENIPAFYSAIPSHYSTNKSPSSYPLIVCFHGAGGFGNGGNELSKALGGAIAQVSERTFPPTFLSGGTKFSFIFLAPQFRQYASDDDVSSFIKYAEDAYRIDTSRIYFISYSIGGKIAGDYAARHPYQIAGLITMGGCPSSDSGFNLETKCSSIASANLPVWSFHNEEDLVWPVNDSKKFVYIITTYNPQIQPRLTLFPGTHPVDNHDCWDMASNPSYTENDINIYQWLLQFHR